MVERGQSFLISSSLCPRELLSWVQNGTMVLLGFLGNLDPALNTVPMIMGRRSVAGSVIGGIAETQEMLDFCGKHNITADVEMIRIQDIDKTFERMLKSDVKYRFVIDMASLKDVSMGKRS